VEAHKVALAGELLAQSTALGVSTLLPIDHVTGDNERKNPLVCRGNIPADRIGLDIGPETITQFSQALTQAKMVLWNGPVGLFEVKPYNQGSRALAQTLAEHYPGLTSIIAGGDTVAAVTAAGVADQITHLSTGGGATLEFLEGKDLPGIKALESIP
jgi:phosphoglycerate kinase